MNKTYEQILTDINAYFDQKVLECPYQNRQFDIEKSRAIAIAYHSTYRDDQYQTKAIEEAFDLPIYDIATQKPTEHRYCGIVDAIVEKNGKLWLADHKTTSRLSPMYWDELKTNPQLTHYLLAARQMGLQVSGFMWDVIVKPGISPMVNKNMDKKYLTELETGYYCGFPFAWDGEKRETPKMYGLRCLSQMIDQPGKYFDRRLIQRSDQELLSYAKELCYIVKEQEAVKHNPSMQYRNLKSCTKYNSMCEYHSLCCGEEDLENTHLYQIKPDTEQKERKTPVDSISTSRIECYLTCRKKWTLKYVDRVEKNVSTYQDSLEIGSMVHEALEIILGSRMSDETISFKQLTS